MVMAAGLFILTNSWAGTYSRLRKTQTQVQIASLLERKVTEIEREYKNKPLDSIPEEKTDTFGSELPQYSWALRSRKLQIPDLSATLTSQDDGASSSLILLMKTFTEHLSKSIKEVNVSVTYTEKSKPITASVTIYMIDYDRPLPVPGSGGGDSGNPGADGGASL